MTNKLELTNEQVENLYSLIKKNKEFPKELVDKLEEVINKNQQIALEEDKLYKERLERYNSDSFLQKVFKTLKEEGYKFDLNGFMERIEDNEIVFYNSTDEWFESYMNGADDYECMKGEFNLLIDLEITESDKGKKVRDKFIEFKLKEFSDRICIVDDIIVEYY